MRLKVTKNEDSKKERDVASVRKPPNDVGCKQPYDDFAQLYLGFAMLQPTLNYELIQALTIFAVVEDPFSCTLCKEWCKQKARLSLIHARDKASCRFLSF